MGFKHISRYNESEDYNEVTRMKNEEQTTSLDLENLNGSVSLFGYELIRDGLLPNLLGKDTEDILYWAGKELARQYPLEDFSAIGLFFKKAGFGTLTLTKEKKHQRIYTLTGDIVKTRIEHTKPSFSLETGFLAEQIQLQETLYAEAVSEVSVKTKEVIITLQWDAKDTVSIEKPLETFVITEENEEPEELSMLEIDSVDALPDKAIESLTEEIELKETFDEEIDGDLFAEELVPEVEPINDVQLELPETAITDEIPVEFEEVLAVEEEEILPPSASVVSQEDVDKFHQMSAEEALSAFDKLSQEFTDVNEQTSSEVEEETIFDTLPSRSSRHQKKTKK